MQLPDVNKKLNWKRATAMPCQHYNRIWSKMHRDD